MPGMIAAVHFCRLVIIEARIRRRMVTASPPLCVHSQIFEVCLIHHTLITQCWLSWAAINPDHDQPLSTLASINHRHFPLTLDPFFKHDSLSIITVCLPSSPMVLNMILGAAIMIEHSHPSSWLTIIHHPWSPCMNLGLTITIEGKLQGGVLCISHRGWTFGQPWNTVTTHLRGPPACGPPAG